MRRTPRGNTHLLIEVFACATEAVPDVGPHDAPVAKPEKKAKRKRGKVVQATVDGSAPGAPSQDRRGAT